MRSDNTVYGLPRELDYRENEGIEVWLLWHKADDRVSVVVRDSGRQESFELEVEPAKALDAFHHPYAHAALAGRSAEPVAA